MAKSTKKWTKLDEDRLKKITSLLSFGLSQTAIAKIVGCSGATVSKVHTSGAKTMADWRAFNKLEREKRANNRPILDTPAKDPAAPNPVAAEPVKATELDRIANALERLAAAWEAQPTKRNIFGK